jgi:hypothetical protein
MLMAARALTVGKEIYKHVMEEGKKEFCGKRGIGINSQCLTICTHAGIFVCAFVCTCT